ncbi:MAG TPA: thymidine phosphorylase [Candidatus Baltobacteraceae bacterium]|nr:thymidine phosphorylase [Candidatus Baltobacteraceae bacterium]
MDEHGMRRCIVHKRKGGALSAKEWEAVIEAFMSGDVDEAQMAALCMACVWRGMSFDEAYALTGAMVASGQTIAFDPARGIVVDKHSSGGVSDIVSLAAVPLAAACGARVAKLSGRALGHTGGTIDKLETIPGFDAELSTEAFVEQVERVGCAIAAQTQALVPADKRIYHLRDRTATVPQMGLIASSIVSKKIAGGAHAFVFDVKTGAASFMSDRNDARELAQWLVEIAQRFGRRATAFVTDMNQPLGRCIGTGIEVIEAREFLRGHGDERAKELVLAIAGALVAESGLEEPQELVQAALSSGRAYGKICEMISAQHGDVAAFEAMKLGPPFEILAAESGYVQSIDVVRLGHAGRALSQNDSLGGLQIAVRIGDHVDSGTQLARAYGSARKEALPLAQAFTISSQPVQAPPLFYDMIGGNTRGTSFH